MGRLTGVPGLLGSRDWILRATLGSCYNGLMDIRKPWFANETEESLKAMAKQKLDEEGVRRDGLPQEVWDEREKVVDLWLGRYEPATSWRTATSSSELYWEFKNWSLYEYPNEEVLNPVIWGMLLKRRGFPAKPNKGRKRKLVRAQQEPKPAITIC